MRRLPTVRCQQVSAIGPAINGHLASGPAIDRADFFALGWTIPFRAAPVADRADRFFSQKCFLRENRLERRTARELHDGQNITVPGLAPGAIPRRRRGPRPGATALASRGVPERARRVTSAIRDRRGSSATFC